MRPITACNCTHAIAAPPSSVQPHTDGSDDILGPHLPAGPDWQKSIRKDVQALTGVEMQSSRSGRASRNIARSSGAREQECLRRKSELKLPNCSFRSVKGEVDLMTGLTFKVADVAKGWDAAKAKGCTVSGDGFDLCGVTFSLAA